MARGRGRGSTRSSNRWQIRSRIRQISRALSFEPRRIAIPPDPPSVRTSYHFNTILYYDLTLGSETASEISKNSIKFKFANTTAGSIDVTVNNLWKTWCNQMLWTCDDTGHDTEISVLRVAYWGPSDPWLTTVPIGLVVDINPPASSISLRDVGTTNARARIGVTVPQTVWYEHNATTVVLRLVPDPAAALANVVPPSKKKENLVTGLNMGTLHVSIGVRRTITF